MTPVVQLGCPTPDSTHLQLISAGQQTRKSDLMYDMYPEWGPAQHDDDYAAYPTYPAGPPQPVQESMDLRDHGGERPDDN
ncbi:MAG: hypothetical protein WAK18_10760 [Nocardioidaceae bacterium]